MRKQNESKKLFIIKFFGENLKKSINRKVEGVDGGGARVVGAIQYNNNRKTGID